MDRLYTVEEQKEPMKKTNLVFIFLSRLGNRVAYIDCLFPHLFNYFARTTCYIWLSLDVPVCVFVPSILSSLLPLLYSSLSFISLPLIFLPSGYPSPTFSLTFAMSLEVSVADSLHEQQRGLYGNYSTMLLETLDCVRPAGL